MDAKEYASLVAEIARQHVCENKPTHKAVVRAVMKHSPMAVLTHSFREPTEDELLEIVERHNPFAAEDLSDELRSRYTAICKLHLDVVEAVKLYREDRFVPSFYRLLDASTSRYLTWAEADPNCDDKLDDKMAEFTSLEDAHKAIADYCRVMSSLAAEPHVELISLNRYHERIQ